jgi:hypothetical protein
MKNKYSLFTAKIYFYFFVICLIFFTGCSKEFLNQTKTTDLTEENTFSDSARSIDFLTQIYSNIDFSFNPARFNGLAGLESACDEAEGPTANTLTTYNQFATGSVSAYSISNDAWSISYSNIRAVNQFITHLSTIPYNSDLKKRTKAEAIFLRAWYYSILLKHYGGVPLIGDSVYSVSSGFNSTRNTYEDCVNYILKECDGAINDLPSSYTGGDFGRVTKAAAMSLKARVLLYAASPLFNGGAIAQAEPLKSITSYPAADIARWKKAADAAKEVIDLSSFHLYEDNITKPGFGFYQVFQLRKNSEFIFQRMKDVSSSYHDLELLWRPPSRGGGSNTGGSPYHNLVDAFQMSNGKDITDVTSGFIADAPYNNRDPRMNYTIVCNGAPMFFVNSNPKPVYTYVGEPTGDGLGQGTPTGYYVNKMCNDDVVPNWFNTTQRCYPLIRYAEILLIYAEAINEFSGPSQEVYEAVESIRKRAGLNPYSLTVGLSKSEMRSVIQHERQVEFAFEEQRFWDVRRWKIALLTDNQPMSGINIVPVGSNKFSYSSFNVRSHIFRESMYLWPIPQTETAKSLDLLQNPGY